MLVYDHDKAQGVSLWLKFTFEILRESPRRCRERGAMRYPRSSRKHVIRCNPCLPRHPVGQIQRLPRMPALWRRRSQYWTLEALGNPDGDNPEARLRESALSCKQAPSLVSVGLRIVRIHWAMQKVCLIAKGPTFGKAYLDCLSIYVLSLSVLHLVSASYPHTEVTRPWARRLATHTQTHTHTA